jgi:hypothetical protein
MKNSKSELGRQPPKYETPEELQAKIQEYFKDGMRFKEVVIGPPNNRSTVTIQVPTITGLCFYLGFESRQSFYDLEKRPQFSYTIKKARLLIEREYEEQLQAGNPTGAIFALKNFDWKDKQEVLHDLGNSLLEKFKDIDTKVLIEKVNAIIGKK